MLVLPQSQKPLVFIMGLHRSGTTFLYESMSDYFEAAKLTVRDIVFYPQLITLMQQSQLDEKNNAISEYFKSANCDKRGNDNIALSSDTAEEYGWILKRWGGEYKSNESTLSLLQEVIDKLAFMHPNKQAIMLKNPWDIGQGNVLAKAFPNAKFVFIKRSPEEILSSEINNALHFTQHEDPLLKLLSNKIKITQTLTIIFRLLRKVLSELQFTKLISKLLISDIVSNLEKYLNDIKAIPAQQVMEISYSSLVEKPQDTFESLSLFLELRTKPMAELPIAKRAKKKINPIVDFAAEKLKQRIKENGLERFLKDKPANDLK
jgi:hypothetical protein